MSAKRKLLTMLSFVFLTMFAGSICTSAMAEENQNSWHKAGQDIKEAAKSVGNATKETYEKTKEKSSEAWHKTKEESKKAYDEGKEESQGFWHSVKVKLKEWYKDAKTSIHSATAPSEEAGKKPEKAPDSSSSSQ